MAYPLSILGYVVIFLMFAGIVVGASGVRQLLNEVRQVRRQQ